jgi:hypothetical protein
VGIKAAGTGEVEGCGRYVGNLMFGGTTQSGIVVGDGGLEARRRARTGLPRSLNSSRSSSHAGCVPGMAKETNTSTLHQAT